jgi:23S rRNA pseudouridine1911/1915/1917 synthase
METFAYTIEDSLVGARLDRVLSAKLPDHSRTSAQNLITHKYVSVNGIQATKSSLKVKLGDMIAVCMPDHVQRTGLPIPDEDMGVRILFEHEEFLIIYKPAGLVVHAPHPHSTEISLVDWLLHSFKNLSHVGPADRPGIVHRLDKDTSGLLIIPRTNSAHTLFSELFKARSIEKTYLAVVKGHPKQEDTIDLPLGRHAVHRHKISVLAHGRESITSYTVERYFQEAALITVRPRTGRTHQIRVHCAAQKHSIVGDALYGTAHPSIGRHALHAYQLAFTYKGRWYSFSYSMPHDMQNLIKKLS